MVDIVIIQPMVREIFLSQIEPSERTPCILGYPSVDDYIFRKQYEETNVLDDKRVGECKVDINNKMQRTYVKWHDESLQGAGVLKEDRYMEAKLEGTCAVCKILQQQMCLWTQGFGMTCFHKERALRCPRK